MKLKSRPFVHYAPVPGGVYLSGPGAQFAITGPPILFQVVDRCVPMLELGATEDDMVAELGSERSRPAVRLVTAALREHGLLLDLDRLTVGEPDRSVRDRFPEALAHFEAHSPDPYAAFRRLRRGTALVCGPAPVILPAVRGLARAGVANLLIGTDDPAAVAATCTRLSAELVPPGSAGLPGRAPADVAVLVLGPGDGGAGRRGGAGPLPGDTDVVPVWVGPRAVLVGPVLDGAGPGLSEAGWARAVELRDRVAAWAGPTATDPDGDVLDHGLALAGALAGQLAFETLGRLPAVPGPVAGVGQVAHVVHGADGDCDRVDLPLPGPPPAAPAPIELTDAAAPDPDVDARPDPSSLDALLALTRRWAGTIRLEADDDLPQLPFALRAATRLADGVRVVARGADQHHAAVAAILAVHRLPAPATGTAGPSADAVDGVDSTPAAGLTDEHWLLDGALRLLADRAAGAAPLPAEVLTLEGELLRDLYVERTGGTAELTVRTVPGLSWVLADVTDPARDAPVASAWGSEPHEAAEQALGDAVASAADGAPVSRRPSTQALLAAPPAAVRRLRADLRALRDVEGLAVVGVPAAADVVLGPVPLRHGRVSLAHPGRVRR